MALLRKLRLAISVALFACASVIGSLPAASQVVDAAQAAKVKAAYILNFVHYTQWPERSFSDPTSPIVLAVVSSCDVSDVLAEAAAQSEPIGGRALSVRRVEPPSANGSTEDGLRQFLDGIRGAHVVYLCSLLPDQARAILRGLDSPLILTVGDIPGFARSGGMLGLVLSGDRIVFEANTQAIQAAEMAVSAKVLKLARVVESNE